MADEYNTERLPVESKTKEEWNEIHWSWRFEVYRILMNDYSMKKEGEISWITRCPAHLVFGVGWNFRKSWHEGVSPKDMASEIAIKKGKRWIIDRERLLRDTPMLEEFLMEKDNGYTYN